MASAQCAIPALTPGSSTPTAPAFGKAPQSDAQEAVFSWPALFNLAIAAGDPGDTDTAAGADFRGAGPGQSTGLELPLASAADSRPHGNSDPIPPGISKRSIRSSDDETGVGGEQAPGERPQSSSQVSGQIDQTIYSASFTGAAAILPSFGLQPVEVPPQQAAPEAIQSDGLSDESNERAAAVANSAPLDQTSPLNWTPLITPGVSAPGLAPGPKIAADSPFPHDAVSPRSESNLAVSRAPSGELHISQPPRDVSPGVQTETEPAGESVHLSAAERPGAGGNRFQGSTGHLFSVSDQSYEGSEPLPLPTKNERPSEPKDHNPADLNGAEHRERGRSETDAIGGAIRKGHEFTREPQLKCATVQLPMLPNGRAIPSAPLDPVSQPAPQSNRDSGQTSAVRPAIEQSMPSPLPVGLPPNGVAVPPQPGTTPGAGSESAPKRAGVPEEYAGLAGDIVAQFGAGPEGPPKTGVAASPDPREAAQKPAETSEPRPLTASDPLQPHTVSGNGDAPALCSPVEDGKTVFVGYHDAKFEIPDLCGPADRVSGAEETPGRFPVPSYPLAERPASRVRLDAQRPASGEESPSQFSIPIKGAINGDLHAIASRAVEETAGGAPVPDACPLFEALQPPERIGTGLRAVAAAPQRDEPSESPLEMFQPAALLSRWHNAANPTAAQPDEPVKREAGHAPLAFSTRLAAIGRQETAAPAGQASQIQASQKPSSHTPAGIDPNSSETEAGRPAPGSAAPREEANFPEPPVSRTSDIIPSAPPVSSGARGPAALDEKSRGAETSAAPAQRPDLRSSESREPSSEPARRITIQMAAEDKRVEVRVSEHSGEIRVAVRTPDSTLAGSLRQELPSLEARFEHSGFRSHDWQFERHPQGRGDAGSNSDRGAGQQDRSDGQRRERREPESPSPSPEGRRKEFACFLSSIV
jgi:hypothetical protein